MFYTYDRTLKFPFDSIINTLVDEVDRTISSTKSVRCSEKGYLYQHNSNECLYKFSIPGVSLDSIKVNYDPEYNTLNISGEEYTVYDIIQPETKKKISYKVMVDSKYDTTNPLLCTLKDGYLYLKFEVKKESKPKQFQINVS